MRGYPRKFYVTLLSTLAALLGSGIFLLPTTLAMRLEWNVAWRLGADARIGMAALHVACAFFGLVLFGSLWTLHMRAGWRQRRNYRNGLLLVSLLVILSISGLGIFYLADETASLYVALSHVVVGLAVPLAFAYHMIAGRRLAKKLHPPRSHAAVVRIPTAAHHSDPSAATPAQKKDYSASRS